MDIINKTREKSVRERENFEKYKLLKGEIETKTVSGIVEKMLKQEKVKEFIIKKRQKDQFDKKMQLDEKNGQFLEMKQKLHKDDNEKMKEFKYKLQKLESNLDMKRVSELI